MYPKDDFNQRLQLERVREQFQQVIIEVQESFNDSRNRTLVIYKDFLSNIEYCGGVLEVSYIHKGGDRVTEFITWDRIRGLTFRDKPIDYNPL